MYTMYINASNITPSYTHNISYLICPGAKLHQRYATTMYEYVHPTPYYHKKTRVTQCKKHQTKAPSHTSKNTSSNMTKDITAIAATTNPKP